MKYVHYNTTNREYSGKCKDKLQVEENACKSHVWQRTCMQNIQRTQQQQHNLKAGRSGAFPAGPVVKNPPSNSGDAGLSPGQGT